ncbi:hypothetical protein RUM43_003956, partial [Polyplax serrata]
SVQLEDEDEESEDRRQKRNGSEEKKYLSITIRPSGNFSTFLAGNESRSPSSVAFAAAAAAAICRFLGIYSSISQIEKYK